MSRIVTMETSYLRYSFDRSGKVIDFLDKKTGKNHAAEENNYAFALYPGNEGEQERELPLSVECSEDIVTVRFENVLFQLQLQCFDDNIRMTIVDVVPLSVDFGRFLFGGCELKDDGMDPNFCGCLIPRSIKCCPMEIPGRCKQVGAMAYSALSAENVSAALIGISPDQLRDAMKNAYADCTIEDTVISPVGGPFAKDIKELSYDYVIEVTKIDFSNDNWLKALKRKNIRQVSFHHSIDYLNNDYIFFAEKFPRGVVDFKEKVVDKLHANGMLAFLHNYSSLVDFRSSFVTPVPSPDLVSIGEYTLAKDLDAEDTCIYIEESTDPIPLVQGDCATVHMATMLVEKELIDVGTKKEHALLDCTRGTLSTVPSHHKKGTKIKHLLNMYNMFVPVAGSALFYEHIARIANVVNEAGFDGIYCDGFGYQNKMLSEKNHGLGWYYESLIIQNILRRVNRPFYVDIYYHPTIWGAQGRTGAMDSVISGYQYITKCHTEKNILHGERRMIPCTLGWWYVYPPMFDKKEQRPNWIRKIVFDDDVDYLGTRAIGYNWGISYHLLNETIKQETEALTLDYLSGKSSAGYRQFYRLYDRIDMYTSLRDERYVPDSICKVLQNNDKNFCIVQKNNRTGFTEQTRLLGKPYSLRDAENEVCMMNPYGKQRPTIRLIAQCAAKSEETAFTIARFQRDVPLSEQQNEVIYNENLNIQGREALGVWVKGTQKDDYVNIQLEAALGFGAQGCAMHVISLNYSGWRYFMLCEHDNGDYTELTFVNDTRKRDEKNCTEIDYFKYGNVLNYANIGALRILYTGDPSEIYMSDICAYPVDDSPVNRPSISINGQELHFETALAPGSYIELKPEENKANMYDIYGNMTEVSITGTWPELLRGENTVRLGGEAAGVFRLKLHLIVKDEKVMWI